MAQKFIISEDGVLKFGNVRLHRDLFIWGEDTCFGGGFWKIDHSRNAIILYWVTGVTQRGVTGVTRGPGSQRGHGDRFRGPHINPNHCGSHNL